MIFLISFFSRTEETPIASVLVYSLQLNYLTYTDPWSDDLENSTSLSNPKKIMGEKKQDKPHSFCIPFLS